MGIPDNIVAPSEQGYIAPTVYLAAGRYVSNWNYYGTFEQAVAKWKFLNNLGGSNVTGKGIISFANNGTAQTMGINVDFYVYLLGKWYLIPYKTVKSFNPNDNVPIIFRFYTTAGNGPYYAILNQFYFGIAATIVKDADPEKVAALDGFYREVQLLKYRYNALVGFMNDLGKRNLSAYEQQIFNEGMLLLNSMNQQIGTIRNIEITYGEGGRIGATIGILPLLAIIAIIAILAAATAWAVSAIITEQEKTKRINDAFELNKWVSDKKLQVSQQVQAGTISQQNANSVLSTLDAAAAAGNAVAKSSSKDKSVFGDIGEIVKFGVLGLLGYMLLTQMKKSNA